MTLQRLEQPPQPHNLAINNPADQIPEHAPVIEDELLFWARQEEQAFSNADLGGDTFAGTVIDGLLRAARGTIDVAIGKPLADGEAQQIRKQALGALAFARLARQIIEVDQNNTFEDVQDTGRVANMVLDVYDEVDGQALPPRIHLEPQEWPALLEADQKWFYQDGLYVQRVDPAQPSARLLHGLQLHSISVPFDNMTTLFPYVASKHITST